MIEFERASSLASGNYLKVVMISEALPTNGWFKKQRKRRIVSDRGWISMEPGSEFRYFESQERNIFKFADMSLEQLKSKIVAYLEPEAG